MSGSIWMAEYDKACAELKEAEAQHRLADSVHCQALQRLDLARRAVVRLYQERIRFLDEGERATT